MIIRLNALDTLFFRDGRPFTMGESPWAAGIFPPYPSVFYGALRTAYFARHPEDLDRANQPGDPTATLEIKGIYLQIGDQVCLPLPADCAGLKEERGKALLMRPEEAPEASSCPVPLVLKPPGGTEVKAEDEGLLDYLSMVDYLNAGKKEFYYILLSDFVLPEPKTGIGRDSASGTAKDHMLYRAVMRRLESRVRTGSKSLTTSFLVEYTGLNLPERGLLKLGGEGKAVFYETPGPDVEKSLCFTAPELRGNRFKLYLATPALFAGGWLPGWLDENTLTGEYRGLKLRLLTAATGKYLSIGGFDVHVGEPKVMRRAVPAGSVYYFELNGGDPAKVMEVFHRASLSDYCPEQGFGHVLVGGVEND